MKREDKDLLIKTIYERLPYNLYYKVEGIEDPVKLFQIEVDNVNNILLNFDYKIDNLPLQVYSLPLQVYLSEVKPYLRSMSSMTEEESEKFEEFLQLQAEYTTGADIRFKYDMFDWLNSRHFDYRHLIEKGLAIEAPEEMYN